MTDTISPVDVQRTQDRRRRPVRPHYKWVALTNTTLGSLMATIDASIVLIALPAIFKPTFRTPIQRFLEISESATNPGTMRLCSSRPNIFLDYRYLGTLWPTAPILRSSRENRFSV